MTKAAAMLFTGIVFFLSSGSSPIAPETRKMRLVWSDEFNVDGLPDSSKWGYDLGDGCPDVCGWGNNELQYYTSNRKENARIENGHLIVEARKEQMGTKGYTSSRMVSKHKGDWKYGRIEVRAKLPKGIGTWAAIWMLPTEWEYGGWPLSGEIDIMENVGFMADSLFGTIHTKRFNGAMGTQVSKGIFCNSLASEFHEYGMEWDAEKIDFFFDGRKYQTFNNLHEGFEAWPFDRDFHVLLNIAVGGDWGGKMGVDATIWPQQMWIDYVRVYQE